MCYVCEIALWVVPRVIYPTQIWSIAWWSSCVVYAYSIVFALTGAIFIDVCFHPKKNSFWSHTVIAIKLYSRRDSCAIVACAKLCSVFHTLKGIKVHRMWIALMKRTLIYIHLVRRENRGTLWSARLLGAPLHQWFHAVAVWHITAGVSLYIYGCIFHKSATPTTTTYTSTNPVNDLVLGRSSNMYGQYSGATLDEFYMYE